MRDNSDFENELANSISRIIDEETAEAKDYVRNNKKNKPSAQFADLNGETRRFDPITDADLEDYREYDDEEEYEEDEEYETRSRKNDSSKRFVIPIVLGVVAIAIIVGAVLIGTRMYHSAIANSQDNYAYNNNMAYEAFNNKDYEHAIEYFNKALSYEEGRENVDMMMYLHDCYVALKDEEKANEMLQKVLEINPLYTNALVLMITEYDDNKDYEGLRELYGKVKATDDEKAIALFDSFLCDAPYASKEGGEYNSDIEVTLGARGDVTIYYTSNGSNPVKSGTLYDQPLTMKEGKFTIQFYAVNEYGFASDIVKEEYSIIYKAPQDATISPGSGSLQTSSVQFITIGNVSKTGKAYYTMDGSTPTAYSTPYNGPFELPLGNTTIKVIVIDDNGLSSNITTATYSLAFIDKYTDEECQELVWAALATQGYCDGSTHLNAEGVEFALGYYSKKVIQDKTVYLYNLFIGPDKQVYFLACDANEGTVYAATQAGADFILSNLEPISAQTANPSEGASEASGENNV